MIRLLLVRHGMTGEMEKNILQGHLQGHLSKTGLNKVNRLATYLKAYSIDKIYSSDLNRTKETVMPIQQFHQDVTINYEESLRERDFGLYSGLSKDYYPQIKETSCGGSESKDSAYNRHVNAIETIIEQNSHKKVLIVTHEGVLKNYFRSLGISEEYLNKIHPASLSIIEKIKQNYKLIKFNFDDY